MPPLRDVGSALCNTLALLSPPGPRHLLRFCVRKLLSNTCQSLLSNLGETKGHGATTFETMPGQSKCGKGISHMRTLSTTSTSCVQHQRHHHTCCWRVAVVFFSRRSRDCLSWISTISAINRSSSSSTSSRSRRTVPVTFETSTRGSNKRYSSIKQREGLPPTIKTDADRVRCMVYAANCTMGNEVDHLVSHHPSRAVRHHHHTPQPLHPRSLCRHPWHSIPRPIKVYGLWADLD